MLNDSKKDFVEKYAESMKSLKNVAQTVVSFVKNPTEEGSNKLIESVEILDNSNNNLKESIMRLVESVVLEGEKNNQSQEDFKAPEDEVEVEAEESENGHKIIAAENVEQEEE